MLRREITGIDLSNRHHSCVDAVSYFSLAQSAFSIQLVSIEWSRALSDACACSPFEFNSQPVN